MLAGVVRRETRRDMVAGVIRSVGAIRWRRASAPWRLNPPPRRDRARWAVAGVLNASGRTCWPDLVSWAMATREEQRKPRTRHPLREVVGTSTCQLDALTTGVCYCGKFTASASVLADAEGGEA